MRSSFYFGGFLETAHFPIADICWRKAILRCAEHEPERSGCILSGYYELSTLVLLKLCLEFYAL